MPQKRDQSSSPSHKLPARPAEGRPAVPTPPLQWPGSTSGSLQRKTATAPKNPAPPGNTLQPPPLHWPNQNGAVQRKTAGGLWKAQVPPPPVRWPGLAPASLQSKPANNPQAAGPSRRAPQAAPPLHWPKGSQAVLSPRQSSSRTGALQRQKAIQRTKVIFDAQPVPGSEEENTHQFRNFLDSLPTYEDALRLHTAFGQLWAQNEWDIQSVHDIEDKANDLFVTTKLGALNSLPAQEIADGCKPVGPDKLLALHNRLRAKSELYLRMTSKTLANKSLMILHEDTKVPYWDAKDEAIVLPHGNNEHEDLRDLVFEMTNAYQHPQHRANQAAFMEGKIDIITYAVRSELIEFNGMKLFLSILDQLPSQVDQVQLPPELVQATRQNDFRKYLAFVRKNGHMQDLIDRSLAEKGGV